MPNDCFFWSWPNPSEVLNFDLEKYENHLQEGFKKQLVYPKPRKSYIMHISTMLLKSTGISASTLQSHWSWLIHIPCGNVPIPVKSWRSATVVFPAGLTMSPFLGMLHVSCRCKRNIAANSLPIGCKSKTESKRNSCFLFKPVNPCSHSLPAVLALLHHHHVPQKWNIKSVKYKKVSWILLYLWCAWNSELFFAFAVACLAFGP